MKLLVPVVLSALTLAAALSRGQDTKPDAHAGQPPAAPVMPPEPPPVPVPDGPVVHKAELEGGLLVEDITIGQGYEIKPGDAVIAHYHGTVKESGKVFESSFGKGVPAMLPLPKMIPGWQKGIPGMKIGGVRRLTIPPAMAWGERGQGADIPPNAAVVFVIQMLDALQVIDVKVGDGEAATDRCVPVTTHVIKDKSGKEIEKVGAGQMYIWLPNEIQGLAMGIDGMKVGGKRRILIPKELNPAVPQMPGGGTRPQNEPLEIEVELIGVRNFGPPRASR